ncbi:dihydrofolate reductase family protein [Kaarinaea lacus]
MAIVVLYIATSLDGYIARSNGDIDWLSTVDGFDEDYGYAEFYNSVDALLMGRKTYIQVRGFGDWPYHGKTSYVLSGRELHSDLPDVRVISPDIDAMVEKISGYKKVWLVGGGKLVRSLHQAGLIDEYIISILPIVLGDGISLFAQPLTQQPLKLVSCRSYQSGLVQLHYQKKSSV